MFSHQESSEVFESFDSFKDESVLLSFARL